MYFSRLLSLPPPGCIPYAVFVRCSSSVFQQQPIALFLVDCNILQEGRDIVRAPPRACEEEVSESLSRVYGKRGCWEVGQGGYDRMTAGEVSQEVIAL